MCNVTGVPVAIHINCSPSDGDVEERLAENITAAATLVNKCAPIVEQLVQLYRQTSVESDKCRYECLIHENYWKGLKGITPWNLLQDQVDMLTKMALGNIRVERAEVSSSIILYCELDTAEALLYLQQMIDSGELSELLSSMLSLLAMTLVVATVSLPPQEYDTAFALLNSAAGKYHLVIIVSMYKTEWFISSLQSVLCCRFVNSVTLSLIASLIVFNSTLSDDEYLLTLSDL